MDADEANPLLRRSAGSGGRVDREPAAAAEIVARCGGLPLALALVAARLAAHPRSTLLSSPWSSGTLSRRSTR